MSDIKNIRLTDFIQGLQEEDTLDYPNNAVRAGSNVTLAETIQTRGGLSTVDSVGLPAGSEIMSLAQVKFPTNEKTYLVAQVYTPPGDAPEVATVKEFRALFMAELDGVVYAKDGIWSDWGDIYYYDINTDEWVSLGEATNAETAGWLWSDVYHSYPQAGAIGYNGLIWAANPTNAYIAEGYPCMFIFDPATNTWIIEDDYLTCPEVNLPLRGRGLVGSKIYYWFGGQAVLGSTKVCYYDTVTHAWSALFDVGNSRYYHLGAIYDGKLYLYGGWWGANALSPLEIIDLSDMSYTQDLTVDIESVNWEGPQDGVELREIQFAATANSLLYFLAYEIWETDNDYHWCFWKMDPSTHSIEPCVNTTLPEHWLEAYNSQLFSSYTWPQQVTLVGTDTDIYIRDNSRTIGYLVDRISLAYLDTDATPETYALYAMSDTLPDTGA